jgi:O-antigen biosynthesis protein
MAKDLSIVIVNYNVKHFLEQCLHAVEKAIQNIEAEVFVVDNNSVDGSNGMVIHKFPFVELMANTRNFGFAVANNQAIRRSTGRYVLLLNPDTVVEEDTFEKVLAFMDANPEAGGLGVKMIDGRGRFLPESKRGLPTPWVAFYKVFGVSALFPKSKRFGKYHLSYLNENEIHEIDVLAGAFMLMRREALDKVGLLDEDFFMYGEDIDLSYRITKGGFKNFYFPETTIIHYKGESTKKGSLNYVRMFYNAMIIFARKHFSTQYAGFFSFFIHLAIYFRAAIATAHRLAKRFWLPALDFATIWAGFAILLPYWERVRFSPDYYPDLFLAIIVPIYIFIWLIASFYSGGYEKPVHLLRYFKGIASGTVFILVAYSLLPEEFRFSRALILLGAAMAATCITFVRLLLHLILKKEFSLTARKPKRVAIVGLKTETKRVHELLEQTGIVTEIVGCISPKRKPRSERYLGSVYQIKEIVRVHQLDELIFCSEDISSQMVIQTMLGLSEFKKLDYKIAPPQSVSIIGSSSIDTAGELYVVNVNAISTEKNKRNKRLFDMVAAFSLLITSPIAVWFISNKNGFFANIFSVILKKRSWVGYHPIKSEAFLTLPAIRKGVLKASDLLDRAEISGEIADRINTLYARDYSPKKDLEILFKSFAKLGTR